MRAGMTLVIGTLVISIAIFGVIMKGAQDLSDDLRYATYQWQEPTPEKDPSLHAVVPDVPDVEAETDDIADEDEEVQEAADDATEELAVSVTYALPVGEIAGTLHVREGIYTLTLAEPLGEVQAKAGLQKWAVTQGRAPFTFEGWIGFEPAR